MLRKKHVVIALLVIMSLLTLTGCGSKETGFKTVDAKEAQQMIKANENIIILDVRENFEFAEGRIPNSVLMPMGTVASSIGQLDKEQEILVVCGVGSRSPVAAEYLVEQGFTKVYDLSGGLSAWPYEIEK